MKEVVKFAAEELTNGEVVPAWLSCLPIKGDLIEAKVVHEQLCTMVERSDRELVGPNNQYLPKIVAVFTEEPVRSFPTPLKAHRFDLPPNQIKVVDALALVASRKRGGKLSKTDAKKSKKNCRLTVSDSLLSTP
ncbi:importin-5-like [Olea europaea subsp. europaea]|uniref:Importin-5-like n=1 Tax=Olea europaea subsp. europaea TaxID=158383 RepID=A0A8S0SEI1_OLEEU|nr:importin-5-like [Olea europaea subsp. europaea]